MFEAKLIIILDIYNLRFTSILVIINACKYKIISILNQMRKNKSNKINSYLTFKIGYFEKSFESNHSGGHRRNPQSK